MTSLFNQGVEVIKEQAKERESDFMKRKFHAGEGNKIMK